MTYYVLSRSCTTFDYHSARSEEAIQPRNYSIETTPSLLFCITVDSKSIGS